jgi:hypothetical protein
LSDGIAAAGAAADGVVGGDIGDESGPLVGSVDIDALSGVLAGGAARPHPKTASIGRTDRLISVVRI